MTVNDDLATAYPALFGPLRWGVVSVASFTSSATVPDRTMIQSVNVVPFIGGQCVVVEVADGQLTLPGGTQEPGETLLQTARRELMEEAGAELVSVGPLGYWNCHSERNEPWRPFLPHPDYVRLVLMGDVELTQLPTNPEDGEQIAHVMLLDLQLAVERFTRAGQPELADLYALAADLRSTRRLDNATLTAFDAAITAT